MSEEYIDKYGVRQVVTDFGSWTSSDAVRAVPKSGLSHSRTDFVNPATPVIPVHEGVGSEQNPQKPFADYTLKATPVQSTFIPQLTDGAWQRAGIAFSAGVRNNPLMVAGTEFYDSVFNPVEFEPDIKYTDSAIIKDIDDTTDKYGLTDEDIVALRNSRSAEEFKYILDKRLDMRIGQKAQSLNTTAGIVGTALPSMVLGAGLGRVASAVMPGSGKGAAVIAALGEGTTELAAAKYADSKYAYDSDWTDALGYAGLGVVPFMKGGFGLDFVSKGYKAAKETVETRGANLKGFGKADYNPKYTGDFSTTGTTFEGKPGSPMEGYKYRQDSPLPDGTLYKENPAGDIRVNGIDMDFPDTELGGKSTKLQDIPPLSSMLEGYGRTGAEGILDLEMSLLESLDVMDEIMGARKLYSEYSNAVKDIDSQLDAGVTPELEADLLKQREVLAQYSGGVIEPYKSKPKLETTSSEGSSGKTGKEPKSEPKVEPKTEPMPEPIVTTDEVLEEVLDVVPEVKSEVKPKVKPKVTKPEVNKDTKAIEKAEVKLKDNKAKLKEYTSQVTALEKKIASKEKAKAKSYSQSAIDKLNAEIKDMKVDLRKARKNLKRAEERLGIVREVVKVVKDIAEYKKAVGKAKGVLESLRKRDVTQEDVKKAIAKAESILRDKEAALAKAQDDK